MGKLQSKHECFLVSADLNKALEHQIWKKKTGFNLANYNMEETLSELSICLEEKNESSPLQVDLPPQKLETNTSKVLTFDHFGISSHGNACSDKAKLNIEELACGVQLEGSENSKQEWSFTLYDFDGHGRITKEDLSSVLKALYDAVGSSIKLPPNGARTLKLRLSVGQESHSVPHNLTSAPHNLTSAPHNLTSATRNINNNKVTKSKVKDFSKFNNLTRTQIKCVNESKTMSAVLPEVPKGEGQTETTTTTTTAGKQIPSVTHHRHLADLVQENMERNKIKQLRRHHSDSRNAESRQHKRRQRNAATTNSASPMQCPVTSANAATLTAAKLAKAATPTTTTCNTNAENNNCGQQKQEERAKESQDRRNYYLDLAGVESTTSKFQNNPTVPLAGSGCVRTGSGHHRSRSHDNAARWDNLRMSGARWGKCDNVRRENERLASKKVAAVAAAAAAAAVTAAATSASKAMTPTKGDSTTKQQQQQHKRSKSSDPQETPAANTTNNGSPATAVPVTTTTTTTTHSPKWQARPKNVSGGGGGAPTAGNGAKATRFRPISLPGHVPVMVSPHYHRRHRHRDKDHSMAMQQVAQWIEREHAWDVDADKLIVQKHEHHHIHEHHHHHHYHHYHEA